jgi:hypothetical protein
MYNCWGYSEPSADEVIDSLGFGVFDNYDEVLPLDDMNPEGSARQVREGSEESTADVTEESNGE